jgi:hypothetical protein
MARTGVGLKIPAKEAKCGRAFGLGSAHRVQRQGAQSTELGATAQLHATRKEGPSPAMPDVFRLPFQSPMNYVAGRAPGRTCSKALHSSRVNFLPPIFAGDSAWALYEKLGYMCSGRRGLCKCLHSALPEGCCCLPSPPMEQGVLCRCM